MRIVLNPQDKSFFDKTLITSEFVRQASICHGCRLCFNYCPAFPKLFELTDSKGPKSLTYDDAVSVASECFHCKMCYTNCPYTPPHEFEMDFADLMEWVWMSYKGVRPLTLREFLFETLDYTNVGRKLISRLYPHTRRLMGISEEAPMPELKEEGFVAKAKPVKVERPVAKVALFHTCLVENFYPEIGEALLDVYGKLGVEVKVVKEFRCCGAPMLDVGDVKRLRENGEHNYRVMEELAKEGYDIVSPIPTCTLMLQKEYPMVLGKNELKVYDSLEYLAKLEKEGKVKVTGRFPKTVLYHPPCHLKYLKVGYNGVNFVRRMGAKVEVSNKGCSGIDGGWGLRNYDKAKKVGQKMMSLFRESNAEVFMTECPLAGLQIQKASGKRPLHPLEVIREAMRNG